MTWLVFRLVRYVGDVEYEGWRMVGGGMVEEVLEGIRLECRGFEIELVRVCFVGRLGYIGKIFRGFWFAK